MLDKYINQLITDLKISESQIAEVNSFLLQIPYSKILPYIEKARQNTTTKDKWQYVKDSYYNNIQLSSFIYPYIYVFETSLKAKISNLMSYSFGFNWYRNVELLSKGNKASRDYINNFIEDYLNKTSHEKQNINDFIENGTTFGFWVSILDSGYFWESKEIELRNIFAEGEVKKTLLSKKQITNKIKAIFINLRIFSIISFI